MTGSPSVGFRHYSQLLRRRWLAIAAGLAIGLVAAGLVLVTAPKRYVASCQVLVLPLRTDLTPVSSTGALTTVNLDTEAQIVRSAAVLDAVRADLGTARTAAELSREVSVTAPANTTILELSFPGRTAVEARRGALAFAHAYLASRTAEGAEVVAARKKSLQVNIDALQTELQRVAPAAEFSRNRVERALAESRRTVLMRQLNSYTSRFQRISTTPLDPGRIIREPSESIAPESPVPELVGPSGLIAGLLLGLAFAVVRDRTDRRVRGARQAGLAPLLGRVRRQRRARLQRRVPELASPAFEQSRRLANRLLLALDQDPATRVVVVLPVGAETGVLTAQVAVAAARGGRRTLLFPTEASRAVASAIVVSADTPGLSIAQPASGDFGDDSLVTSLRPLISRGRQTHDLLLVEAPPVRAGSGAQTLASWSDGVIVVFRPGRTTRAELGTALGQLERVGAPVLGSVAAVRRSWLRRLLKPGRRAEARAELVDAVATVDAPDRVPAVRS